MTQPAIQVKNLSKAYGPTLALKDVSFEVRRGEIVGFLGPNGAGKTTTMRILVGYLPPTSGTAVVDGYDVLTNSLEVRRRIGYLPENISLYNDMTVEAFLEFIATIRGVPRKQIRERVRTVMARTRLEHMARVLIGKLSRGYRQRVGLAQALVHDPPILILDEPTVGLDPRQIIETRQLIKSLAGDHTVILSSHILPEVSMTCQRVLVIHQGQIVAEDAPENLAARLRGSERIRVEVRGPADRVRRALEAVPGVLAVIPEERDGVARFAVDCAVGTDLREQIAEAVVRGGWGLRELRPVGMSLEEIFLKLTTEEPEGDAGDPGDNG
jgi:ABC-2 type transport system ATP-binding protein